LLLLLYVIDCIHLIDEAHRFISVKYPQVTEFIEKLVRRTRKYFAGLWFATQSILDFIPDGNITAAGSIKVIFSLVQYRLVLKQSPESIEILHQAFPQFSYAELKESTAFEPGQMLLSLGAGRDKLHCRRIVGARQLLYMGICRLIITSCFLRSCVVFCCCSLMFG
jgi:type IV secretory pathway VirB4 component